MPITQLNKLNPVGSISLSFLCFSLFLGYALNAFFHFQVNYLLVAIALPYILFLVYSSRFSPSAGYLTLFLLSTFLVSSLISTYYYHPDYDVCIIALCYGLAFFLYFRRSIVNLTLFLGLVDIIFILSFVYAILSFLFPSTLPLTPDLALLGLGRSASFFGTSKAYADFLLFYYFLRHRQLSVLANLLLCLSLLLCGSRYAMFIVYASFIFRVFRIVPRFNLFLRKYLSTPNSLVYSLFVLLAIATLVSMYADLFQDTFLYTIPRFSSLLTLDYFSDSDGGNAFRSYIFSRYVSCISDFSLPHLIFGDAGYCATIFKNGSESFFLDVLSNSGLLVLIVLVFISALLILSIKDTDFRFAFALFLGSLPFHRYGYSGFMGVYLFLAFFSKFSDETRVYSRLFPSTISSFYRITP